MDDANICCQEIARPMTAAPAPIERDATHRGSLFLEDAVITDISRFPGKQYVMRLTARRCAQTAQPGSFVHVQCDPSLPMRRPLSIMRASRSEGWIEILFKIVGSGLRSLAMRRTGAEVSLIGPIGRPFLPAGDRPKKLLIGGGVGIPPMIFLAEHLRQSFAASSALVLMGSEIPFPFESVRSNLATNWLADKVDRTMPLLESQGIPARLASLSDFAGCYRGYVTDLAREWLSSLSTAEIRQCEVFSCGPTVMLEAVTRMACEYDLPCQVSLEEYMACGVGGCAGCTVQVATDDGPAMKRVCVDGPVFEGSTIYGTGSV